MSSFHDTSCGILKVFEEINATKIFLTKSSKISPHFYFLPRASHLSLTLVQPSFTFCISLYQLNFHYHCDTSAKPSNKISLALCCILWLHSPSGKPALPVQQSLFCPHISDSSSSTSLPVVKYSSMWCSLFFCWSCRQQPATSSLNLHFFFFQLESVTLGKILLLALPGRLMASYLPCAKSPGLTRASDLLTAARPSSALPTGLLSLYTSTYCRFTRGISEFMMTHTWACVSA